MGNYLYKHKNGNYIFKVFNHNVKIRETDENTLNPDFPEIINFIINKYNYDGYIIQPNILNYDFFNDILNFSEINIYGTNILEHHQLTDFLNIFKQKRCYIRLYVDQIYLTKKTIELLNILYQNNTFKELHINIEKINKFLIDFINNKNYIYCELMTHKFSLKQLNKLKNQNVFLKSCNNENIINKRQIFNKKTLKKNIYNIIKEFDNIELDYTTVTQFNLEEQLPNNYDVSFNQLFSMLFDFVDKSYSKSFNSYTKFKISSDLKEMFQTIKSL